MSVCLAILLLAMVAMPLSVDKHYKSIFGYTLNSSKKSLYRVIAWFCLLCSFVCMLCLSERPHIDVIVWLASICLLIGIVALVLTLTELEKNV